MSDLLNQASLVMIPSGYKEDVAYSQIPTDGSGDLSFTRASNGTRVNSAGLVEVTPWNLFQYSEDLSNASNWFTISATITTNTTTAPNGTLTADKLTATATTSTHILLQQPAGSVSGATSTVSIYAKSAGLSNIQFLNNAGGLGVANFNLSAGTAVLVNGVSASIENVGNGWYRCIMTYTPTTTGNYNIQIRLADSSGNTTFLGNGTDGVFLWGAQLNIGSTAKPYFPTTDRLNVPRLTYQNGGGGCPSLLLEPQRTNVFTYSEQFNDASWVKFNSSVSANTTNSPDGTQNADSLIENTSNTDHGFYKFAPTITTASGAVTISCFIKSNGRRVQIKNSYTTDASNFDLQNGVVVSNVGSGVGEIQNIGDGWYRCILKTTANASGNAGLTLSLLDNSNNMVYTGNGTSGVFVWGAQLEASSYPTSYIPSTSSSATRVADACSKTGISSLIGQSEGTLFVDFVKSQDGYNYYNLSDGTNNNRIFVGQDADAPNRLRAYIRQGGNTASVDINVGPVANGRYKMAIGYKLNDVVFYINGTLSGTDTSTLMPTGLSDLSLTNLTGGSASVITHTNQVALFKTRLTNAELASLTTI